MDEVVVEVEKTKREWEDAYEKTIVHIMAIQVYLKSRSGDGGEEKISLQRRNGLAQDGLSLLNSLQFNLDRLAPQLSSDDQSLLQTWKNQYHSLRVNLTSANLQAKDNMRKAAEAERELLLGCGRGEGRNRVHSSQTQTTVCTSCLSLGIDFCGYRRSKEVQTLWWPLMNLLDTYKSRE